MKTKKIKTFVITVSRNFPVTHKRAGEPTYFKEKIINQKVLEGQLTDRESIDIAYFCREYGVGTKIHTIRANYPFWAKRIEQVRTGEAILSIRYWSGKPYNSKQVEICQLGKDDGVGVQEIEFQKMFFETGWIIGQSESADQLMTNIAKNDGLSLEDFKEWFKHYDLSKPLAIIHFTKLRY